MHASVVRNKFPPSERRPEVSESDWLDWTWQVRHSLAEGIPAGSFVSPYYQSRAQNGRSDDAIRTLIASSRQEFRADSLFLATDEKIDQCLSSTPRKKPWVFFDASLLPRLPCRVTAEFIGALSRRDQVLVNVCFNHPEECTTDAFDACGRLADAGFIVNNRMILQTGLNDDAQVVKNLNHRLLMMRVRPYCIFVPSPEGRAAGVRLIENLRGWTSGLAVPHLIMEWERKAEIPNYVKAIDGDVYVFRNYRDKEFRYIGS